MVTLIGRRERMAFEFELTPVEDELRRWMFGRMCLWIDGQRIGRHDEDCALAVALSSLAEIQKHAGKREDAALMSMPAADAFAVIHAAIYSDSDDAEPYREASERVRRYQCFEIASNGFDYFDGWHAFLIEDQLVGRAIWRSPDDAIHEARVGSGEFDRVLDGFLSELERISDRTRPQPLRGG
jgi:hypothetical protein